MAVRNNESPASLKRRPVQVESQDPTQDEVEVTHSRLEPSEPLSIDDDEFGGDPYNSTGRFSALIEKKKASES